MTSAAPSPTAAPVAAVAMMLGSCLSLQVGAALASQLFARAGSGGTTLLRLGLAAVVLVVLVRPDVRGWRRAQWRSVVLLGGSLAAMNGFFYASISRIPLGVAVTVEFLGPLALAAARTRRPREWLWVGLALVGVLVLGAGEGATGVALDGLGLALSAIAGVFWALYILASAKVGAVIPGQSGLAVATAVGAALLVPLGAAGAAQAVADPSAIALALGTAVLASVVPYSLELRALRALPVRTFGVLLSMEPAVAVLAGWLLLSQRLGAGGVMGVLVVVAASVGATASVRAADGASAATSPDDARGLVPEPA